MGAFPYIEVQKPAENQNASGQINPVKPSIDSTVAKTTYTDADEQEWI